MNSPDEAPEAGIIEVGPWKAHHASGELIGFGSTQTLEPKVRDLLFLLAAHRGEVVTREEITARLWPRVVVNEDSLARCVFKLRKALRDEARAPRYIETLPKRGYRLTAAPTESVVAPARPRRAWWIAGAAAAGIAAVIISSFAPNSRAVPESTLLLNRADDFYHQMNQVQNEAAIELYSRLVKSDEQLAGAYAGLANSFAQRAIRWPRGAETGTAYANLAEAIRGGEMRTGYAAQQLVEAQKFAENAVALAPHDARTHKALGLVLSAREDFAGALVSHRRAMQLDPDAWEPLIDAADVLELSGRPGEALPYLEAAYDAMTRQRDRQTTRIMPWYAATAVLIGDRHEKAGDADTAKRWYQRALDYAPLDINATRRLASLLAKGGDRQSAARLCDQLRRRVVRSDACTGAIADAGPNS
jgi:DNA-binding winged helix-turn-helix (wHTH) protein/Flp pilus assembly protein TadD